MAKQKFRATRGVLLMTLTVNLVTLGHSNLDPDRASPSAATSAAAASSMEGVGDGVVGDKGSPPRSFSSRSSGGVDPLQPQQYQQRRPAPRNQKKESGHFKVDVPGDVIFGGLFPMHEKGTHGANCGKIKKEKGIQRLEAMLLAVDLINRDPELLPGLTLGMRILDTCSYDTFALEQCMDFIKAQLSTIDLEDYRCADNQSPSYNRLQPVAGVIGAASSTVSIMVANILRLFKRKTKLP